MPSQFVFCSCQVGAEGALKGEVAARLPEWRFAYSRPGFVTFRLPKETTPERFDTPRLTFARVVCLSFDKLTGEEQAGALAERLWALPGVASLIEAGPVGLHVWQRETDLPGEDGVEPGPTELSLAAAEAIRAAAPPGVLHVNKPAAGAEGDAPPKPPAERTPGRRVALDVVLVEPAEWWVGAHPVRSRTDRWPGGTPGLVLPEEAVSRAYLKLQEGLRWAAPPANRGDLWIEVGCAPGGASQALLDAGMRVVGVDPGEVDPLVLANPRFRHVRRRAAETPFDELKGALWLTADINAAPATTLAAVEEIVTHASTNLRGLLLTLKLLSHDLARPERVAEAIERVRSWGFADVRARQLAFNRREYCVAALKSRAQRRVPRGRRPAKKR